MIKFIYVFLLSFIILFYSGCSNKNVQIESTNSSVKKIYEEDLFLDEFADEMKVEKRFDPFSGYNRVMTNFNNGLYEYILAPVGRGYKNVVHVEIRNSVGNFFHNIMYPIRLANNVLQGKIKNSGEETGRFVINSTIGILGLFDPAKSYFKLIPHNEDFGQTLGYWGVGAGPHIVLPFLGPSNLRDTLSLYPTSFVNPIDYQENRNYNLTNNYREILGLKVLNRVNYVSLHEGEYEKLKKDAVDLYPFLRDVYEQYREKKIRE